MHSLLQARAVISWIQSFREGDAHSLEEIEIVPDTKEAARDDQGYQGAHRGRRQNAPDIRLCQRPFFVIIPLHGAGPSSLREL